MFPWANNVRQWKPNLRGSGPVARVFRKEYESKA